MNYSSVLTALLFLCALPIHADELVDYLQAYVGRWIGDFRIHSTANGYTETFSVEQRYWWDKEVLHGLLVTERDSGMQSAKSKTWVEDKKLFAEIYRGETKEVYIGVLHDGGLLWLSSDMRRANDYQMREVLVKEEGGSEKMLIEGFDTYVYKEGLAHLIYKGELLKQPEAADPN